MTRTQMPFDFAQAIPRYVDGAMPDGERVDFEAFLARDREAREALEKFRFILDLGRRSFGPAPELNLNLPGSGALQAALEPPSKSSDGFAASLLRRLQCLPFWLISAAFHVLALALLSLIGMAARNLGEPEAVIVTSNLERPLQARAELPASRTRGLFDALETRPATDSNADLPHPAAVTQEILARAELADHFETINPEMPDSRSAHGNPDARSFHDSKGIDEGDGGGGSGGVSTALADLIGAGGAGSGETGGGWGGGNGDGTGAGNGSGRGTFGHRLSGGRKLLVLRHGGSAATESAVEKGLAYLARVQEPDGHWSASKHEGMAGAKGRHSDLEVDTAVTGLALLAFLGAGHSEKVGKYKEQVRKGVEYLIGIQGADGAVGPTGYAHSIAGMVLTEAAGMGRVDKTRAAAQKAIALDNGAGTKLEGSSERGGWNYGYTQLATVQGDISNSGWHIMFLKSAKSAGLRVEQACIEGVTLYLNAVERGRKPDDPYSGHRYVYAPGEDESHVTPQRTAIGCLGRLFFGAKPESLEGGVKYMLEAGGNPRRAQNGAMSLYYVYYGTFVAFQMGGEIWKEWNKSLLNALLPFQVKDGGPKDGSWAPVGENAAYWGRVGETALSVMCLEVYYRYLPMYRD